MPGFNLLDELLYQIAVSFSTEPDPKSDKNCPLSYEVLYEVAGQFYDEEQEDMMNTSEPPAALLQPSKCKCTTRTAKQEIHFDCYKNTYVFTPLETEL